jgi:hypothetical protein
MHGQSIGKFEEAPSLAKTSAHTFSSRILWSITTLQYLRNNKLLNAINLVCKIMIMQNFISNQQYRLQRVRVANNIHVSINPT